MACCAFAIYLLGWLLTKFGRLRGWFGLPQKPSAVPPSSQWRLAGSKSAALPRSRFSKATTWLALICAVALVIALVVEVQSQVHADHLRQMVSFGSRLCGVGLTRGGL